MDFSRPQTVSSRLSKAAENLKMRLGSPGVTVAFVGADGGVLESASGFSDVEAQRPMTPSNRMLGGSTGKTIFAATAVGLTLRKVIDLDRPIENWLGNAAWFKRVPNARLLTLRDLLRHAGGVPDHMGQPGLMDRLRSIVGQFGPDGYLKPEQSVEMITGLSPIAEPGSQFFYSDTGYLLVGLALEAATGKSLYDLAQEFVLSPLQMSATEPSVKRSYASLAIPYQSTNSSSGVRSADPNGVLPYSPRMEWAGGGFVTCSKDLAIFIHAYAGGSLYAEPYLSWATNAIRYSWGPKHMGGYGLGLFAGSSPLGPTLGHGGYYPGFVSQMTHFPDRGISVAYQANQSSAFDSYSDVVDSRIEAASKRLNPSAPFSVERDHAVRLAADVLGEDIGD